MLQTIPVSVWDQIAVVIVFAILLGGMGWYGSKLFIRAIKDVSAENAKAIREINAENAKVIAEVNIQWQRYFDARSESSNQLSQELTKRMDEIAQILGGLVKDFSNHDQMERQALDEMAGKRRLTKRA